MCRIPAFRRTIFLLLLCCSRKEYLGNSLGFIERTLFFRRPTIFSRWLLGNKSGTVLLVATTGNGFQHRSILPSSTTANDAGTKSQKPSLVPVAETRKYHLINSPDVPLQILIWTALLIILRLAASRFGNRAAYLTVANKGFILLPFFSSACCAIQLALNIIFTGMGCVGFNKVLGPARPLFLSILIHWTWNAATLLLLSSSRSKRHNLVLLLTLVASWSISLLPEIIHYKNTNKKVSTPLIRNGHMVEILLTVPSMGCVACVNKVSSRLQKFFDDNSDLFSLSASSSPPYVTAGSGTDESWLDNGRIQQPANDICPDNTNTPQLHNISAWLSDGGDFTSEKSGGYARIIVSTPPTLDPKYNLSLLGEKLSQVVQLSGFHDCFVSSINEVIL
jgi:hypothetical protein